MAAHESPRIARTPDLPAQFSLSTPSGLAALDAEVTRQAAMVAYGNDFMLLAFGTLPLLLLMHDPRGRPTPAIAPAPADD